MAYRYADTRAKHIDLQMKSGCVCNGRVLSHDNTDNLHEIKITNSLVSLNKEGVARVQHPMDIYIFESENKNKYKGYRCISNTSQ